MTPPTILTAGFRAFFPVAGLHIVAATAGCLVRAADMVSGADIGHSGRPLVFGPGLAMACALFPPAALLRALGSFADIDLYWNAAIASGVFFCVVYGIFTVGLWTPLTTSRSRKAPDNANELKGTT